MQRLVITPGEPAGIGPELVVRLAQQPPPRCELVVVASADLLQGAARQLTLPLRLRPFDPANARACAPGTLAVVDTPLASGNRPGQLNPDNAAYVLATLKRATELCLSREVDAVITGPVHKGVINDAGIRFSGHTEFLAQQAGRERVVMMLATEGLRVALATTHLPLKDVPAAITVAGITATLEILHADLVHRFGIERPHILVSGLNPHAGEGGHLGREEIAVIEPALAALRSRGLRLTGPLPADTLFTPHHLDTADAVLAMYHDQGLPVLKYRGFGKAVNVTLGLPFIRTSVDHGTALDLAGKGIADIGSLRYACEVAVQMVKACHQRGGLDA